MPITNDVKLLGHGVIVRRLYYRYNTGIKMEKTWPTIPAPCDNAPFWLNEFNMIGSKLQFSTTKAAGEGRHPRITGRKGVTALPFLQISIKFRLLGWSSLRLDF